MKKFNSININNNSINFKEKFKVEKIRDISTVRKYS